MNGKTCKGSAHSGAPGLHLLSAVTHAPVTTIAQVEVGSKTNETRCVRPLLAPLELAGTTVTIHALHSVKATITRLVTAKKAHYIAVLKTNQPTPHRQLTALSWNAIPVPHTASTDAHGRRESRSIKTCAIADTFGGINFPTPT
ncbi:transposase [Streptomyces olivaceoviridis]|uniref:transposase n=1 Tax=Streptomyces olivaceoviridis TaxID=1921 RepID=UPI0036AA9A77